MNEPAQNPALLEAIRDLPAALDDLHRRARAKIQREEPRRRRLIRALARRLRALEETR